MKERDGWLLERAFEEAQLAAWLYTAPNPRVGALALAGGHLLGAGRHERYGGPHAEENALRAAGAWDEEQGRPRPGVAEELVISLEPCSSRGPGKKRRPCTDLILEAGVRRVVVGATDPNPEHAGRGLEALRGSGVEVVLAPGGAARFRAMNLAFLQGVTRAERPWVLLKWAASFDGKTAAAGGASRWISGEASRREVHELRACSDAVLCGKGTLVQDDPLLSARPAGRVVERQPLRVLLLGDGRLPLPEPPRLLEEPGPRLWILRHGATPDPVLAGVWQASIDQWRALPAGRDGRLDLAAVLAHLRQEWSVRRLFVEGGPRLHGALLDAGLADAVLRYEAPLLLGGEHGAVLARSSPAPAQAWRLVCEERAELQEDLRRAFLLENVP